MKKEIYIQKVPMFKTLVGKSARDFEATMFWPGNEVFICNKILLPPTNVATRRSRTRFHDLPATNEKNKTIIYLTTSQLKRTLEKACKKSLQIKGLTQENPETEISTIPIEQTFSFIFKLKWSKGERLIALGNPERKILILFLKKFLKQNGVTLRGKEKDEFGERIFREFMPKISKPKSLTIGCDPELALSKENLSKKFRIKSVTLKGDKEGPVTYSAREFLREGHCPIGTDGNSRIAELRPSPSTSPYILTKNLKALLHVAHQEIRRKNKKIILCAGGGHEDSIGGHIHLGGDRIKRAVLSRTYRPLLTLLDEFLYWPIKRNMPGSLRSWGHHPIVAGRELEAAITELQKQNPDDKARLRFTGYDRPSAIRGCDYGIEYRSLPSYICNFRFTFLVHKLAFKIAEKFSKMLETGGTIRINTPPTKEDYQMFLTKKETDELFQYFDKNNPKNLALVKAIHQGWKLKTDSVLIRAETRVSGITTRSVITEVCSTFGMKYDKLLYGIFRKQQFNLLVQEKNQPPSVACLGPRAGVVRFGAPSLSREEIEFITQDNPGRDGVICGKLPHDIDRARNSLEFLLKKWVILGAMIRYGVPAAKRVQRTIKIHNTKKLGLPLYSTVEIFPRPVRNLHRHHEANRTSSHNVAIGRGGATTSTPHSWMWIPTPGDQGRGQANG
ncbi:MAG: hypothetical protein JRI45_06675 [Deltaproteobacteria bacterium]|nr:hypothetical protein [Deltaproteobacteria bacterium]